MSSYGNRVWTQEREDIAARLVRLASDCDDVGFQLFIGTLAMQPRELLAVTAILAERLADVTPPDTAILAERLADVTPIELNRYERAAALEALRLARDEGCSPVSTLAGILDEVNRIRTAPVI